MVLENLPSTGGRRVSSKLRTRGGASWHIASLLNTVQGFRSF